MKSFVAKRRLKHGCDQCRKPILKGQVYYRKRFVFTDDMGVYGSNLTYCPKCKYSNEQQELRYEKFRDKCRHPEEFINEVWTYIPGETVKEPSYCECMLCGSYL